MGSGVIKICVRQRIGIDMVQGEGVDNDLVF